jgi:hypothetical protein
MTELPAFIDLEASGFGRGSYPIEVGFILREGGTYCSLIAPPGHWSHWDAKAEAIHHITREILLAHGKPAAEVAAALNHQLDGQTIYTDGWAHDYAWLNLLFDEADVAPAFRLENLRALLTESEADAWQACKQTVLNELLVPRHRASTDARVLQLTLLRLRQGEPVRSG